MNLGSPLADFNFWLGTVLPASIIHFRWFQTVSFFIWLANPVISCTSSDQVDNINASGGGWEEDDGYRALKHRTGFGWWTMNGTLCNWFLSCVSGRVRVRWHLCSCVVASVIHIQKKDRSWETKHDAFSVLTYSWKPTKFLCNSLTSRGVSFNWVPMPQSDRNVHCSIGTPQSLTFHFLSSFFSAAFLLASAPSGGKKSFAACWIYIDWSCPIPQSRKSKENSCLVTPAVKLTSASIFWSKFITSFSSVV